jgi:hypothetical protein
MAKGGNKGRLLAIVLIVIAALFVVVMTLGGFGSNDSLMGNYCIASQGFSCQRLLYAHSTGNLTLDVIQKTGTDWKGVVFAYAPQGTPATANGIPEISAAGVSSDHALPSGVMLALALGAGGAASGTQTAGSVWACYNTNGAYIAHASFDNLTGCTYVQMATLTAKAS